MHPELKKVQERSLNQNCRSIMFPKVRKSQQTIKASKQRTFHIQEERMFPKSNIFKKVLVQKVPNSSKVFPSPEALIAGKIARFLP